jgi:hypothetical protein
MFFPSCLTQFRRSLLKLIIIGNSLRTTFAIWIFDGFLNDGVDLVLIYFKATSSLICAGSSSYHRLIPTKLYNCYYERVAKIALGNYKKEEKHDKNITSISKLGGLEICILTESFVFDINYV